MLLKTAMIMPTLMYIRKQKMCLIRKALVLLSFIFLAISPMITSVSNANVATRSVELKTLKVTLPTSYGNLEGEIHFNEKDLGAALRIEKIIREDLIKIINYFKYVPKTTVHFNLDPYVHATNGNARVFPTNIINMYNYPPSNSEHLIVLEDWLLGLVFHEYIHITHLDQTNGYLKLGESLFGSIAKVPASVVPRWFTEGIAVWGESYLMKGGRLHNPMFNKEFALRMNDENYCKTIDCLDDPGVFPGGQLSYWAGGHFIEYLELKKPESVRCLVESNSGNVPFFLNNVFRECTGKTAQENFSAFLEPYKKLKEREDLGKKLPVEFGITDWQKGVILDGHTLYKIEKNRFREAIVSYDLEEKMPLISKSFSYILTDLVGVVSLPDEDELGVYNKFLIAAFIDDLNYRGDNHSWKLINAETLLVEATLPFIHDPSYVISLGNNRYLTASFHEGQWLIERQKIDIRTNKLQDHDVVLSLDPENNLLMFKSVGQRILLKIHKQKTGSTLYFSDLTLEKINKFHESDVPFDVTWFREKYFIISEGKKNYLYEFNEQDELSKSEINNEQMDNVSTILANESHTVSLSDDLRVSDISDVELINKLDNMTTAKQSIQVNNVQLTSDNLAMKSDIELESYPKLYHLMPHYWFLASGSSENLGSFGALTEFSDPMGENIITATLLSYPSVTKFGGDISAFHRFSSVTDLWSAQFNFSQEFSKTSFDTQINSTQEVSFGSSYEMQMKKWTWYPGIFIGKTDTKDFISNRNTKNIGLSSIVTYGALSYDDLINNFIYQTRFQKDHPSSGASYNNWQNLVKSTLKLSEDFDLELKFSYSKLFKTGFSQGVLYAGGSNFLGTRRWHEFYGLPYSNAFGNTVSTQRVLLDYNVVNIYRGIGLIPVFFKEIHLRGGKDFLSADRIVLGKYSFRDSKIDSWFIGPRLKMNVFYYVPADMDFVYSVINRPDGGVLGQIDFNLNIEMF